MFPDAAAGYCQDDSQRGEQVGHYRRMAPRQVEFIGGLHAVIACLDCTRKVLLKRLGLQGAEAPVFAATGPVARE